jgi:pilus assembly protein Flp/PilA
MGFFDEEKGQGLIEYALVLVLVAVVIIAILALLGPYIQDWINAFVEWLRQLVNG